MNNFDNVVLICKECGSSQVNAKKGINGIYRIDCLNCTNWENRDTKTLSFTRRDEPMIPKESKVTLSYMSLIDDLVDKCTETSLETLNENNILLPDMVDKLVTGIKDGLTHAYEEDREKRIKEANDKIVYDLRGEDVVEILDEIDRGDLADNHLILEDMVEYVSDNIEIPWMDIMRDLITEMIDRERY